MSDSGVLTGQDFVERLRRSLRRDGDFPASARVVSELKKLVSKPDTTANQITELILQEPSLGTRVLHLVNSSFYKRAKPIMTISQAVVQIGMRPLAELCSGLVLLQKFAPRAREGGAFANCLQQTVTTSLLASTLTSEMGTKKTKKEDETGYLAGTFYELGVLLLAYYFPKVYDSALKRSKTKNQSLSQSILEITGLTPTGLSLEVIDELRLPDFYKQVLEQAESLRDESVQGVAMAKALYAAHEISAVLSNDQGKGQLDKIVTRLHERFGLDEKVLPQAIGKLSEAFKEQCLSLELPLPELPSYVRTFTDSEGNVRIPTVVASGAGGAADDNPDQFTHYVEEIREAVEGREPTSSVITSVMETLTWGMLFDRVILLLMNKGKTELVGRMALGNIPDFAPGQFKRSLGKDAGPYAPDVKAVRESRVIFQGDPFFEDGWPIAVIPVGFEDKAIGVIYADRIQSGQDELSSREQAALGMLADLLDRSVSMNT